MADHNAHHMGRVDDAPPHLREKNRFLRGDLQGASNSVSKSKIRWRLVTLALIGSIRLFIMKTDVTHQTKKRCCNAKVIVTIRLVMA